MHTYKDKAGRKWEISLSLEDVIDLEDIDYTPILDFTPKFRKIDQETLLAVLQSPFLAGVIGWYFAKKQVAAQNIPDNVSIKEEEYYRSLEAEHIDALAKAFVEEYAGFFRMTPTSIQKLIETCSRLRKIGEEELINAVDEKFSEDNLREMLRQDISRIAEEMDQKPLAGIQP